MSWITQNKFLAALLAVTVVLSGLILFFGNKASNRYQEEVLAFQEASAQVASYERLALYPSQPNLDGKKKAISDYQESIQDLISEFDKFQTEAEDRISPQEFGNRLVATNERITGRLSEADVILPDGFYSGFETYTGTLAQSGATNVLRHQLEITDHILRDLAVAKPVELNNFLREIQPEETGGTFEPKPDEITRPHSFELTFHGTEASARRFITSLVDTSEHFIVIRALRIVNETTTAPNSSSAKFTAEAPAVGAPANPFGGNFANLFENALEPGAEGEDEDEDVANAPIQPVAPAADGARKLGQVAGNELVRVFIRFDVMEFLPQGTANPSDES